MRTAMRWAIALLVCVSAGASITGAIGAAAFTLLLMFGADGANVAAIGWAVIMLGLGFGGLLLSDYLEANL